MVQEIIHVYLMPGMAASPKIFEHIKLPENQFKIHLLEWIIPIDNESLSDYALRLSKHIEHINSIFVRDSTNTKLGLVVSTNVNEILQSCLLDSEDETVTNVPSGSVMSPRGTILHGSNENVAEEKRAQLEIFYTEPEN